VRGPAFSETNFVEDLHKFDVRTLVVHGDDDQIVPFKDSAPKSVELIPSAQKIYYRGAPHGVIATLQDQINTDLLALLRSRGDPTSRPVAPRPST
jgi:non-heme chloroperoxidase